MGPLMVLIALPFMILTGHRSGFIYGSLVVIAAFSLPFILGPAYSNVFQFAAQMMQYLPLGSGMKSGITLRSAFLARNGDARSRRISVHIFEKKDLG